MVTLRFNALVLFLAIAFKATTDALVLTSPAFVDNGIIPAQYSCDSADTSPPLMWSDVPFGTVSFALALVDPDAVYGANPPMPWVHWIIYNIPGSDSSLPASIPNTSPLANGAEQGLNSYGVFGMSYPNGPTGWAGMCPLELDGRIHTYPFTLYALSTDLPENANYNITGFQAAIQGSVLQAVTLTGYYQANRMQLTSTAFEEGGTIPNMYSCNGENLSPPLQFGGIPEGTASLAFLLQDPYPIESDPSMTWTHWVWYNNSAPTAATTALTNIAENQPHTLVLPDGTVQGLNSWGTVVGDTSPVGIGWGGPCPNPGDYRVHTYPLTLYALNAPILEDPTQNMTAETMLNILASDSVIFSTSLTGYYQVLPPPATADPVTVPVAAPSDPVPIPGATPITPVATPATPATTVVTPANPDSGLDLGPTMSPISVLITPLTPAPVATSNAVPVYAANIVYSAISVLFMVNFLY